MRLESIMTRDVVTVTPDTPLKDVAAILVERSISGVPVCEADGTLVGVVSEADILRKEEGFAPEQLPRLLAWFLQVFDGELDKVGASTAREAMTSPAVTARPLQLSSDAARVMVEKSINRLPVVAGDKLVGIVSRADLVRAFSRTDAELRKEIESEVFEKTLMLEPEQLGLEVAKGRVTVRGRVASEADAVVLRRCIKRIPGVVSLEADLDWPPAKRNHDLAGPRWP